MGKTKVLICLQPNWCQLEVLAEVDLVLDDALEEVEEAANAANARWKALR